MTPLDDISAFVNQLRTEHRRTADTEHAWLALKETVAGLTGFRCPPMRPPASPPASNC